MDKLELEPLTTKTITDRETFKKEIEKVRRLGYATSRNETDEGIAGIAVPIPQYVEPASITISGPDERLAPRFLELAPELKKKANEISLDLLRLRKRS